VSCGDHGECAAPNTCGCDPDWGGSTCSECPPDACQGANSLCFKTTDRAVIDALANSTGAFNSTAVSVNLSRNLTCACPTGYAGGGATSCVPVCPLGCVNGNCTAPGVCECNTAPGTEAPAWSGPNCTVCVDGMHGCDVHASCVDATSAQPVADCVCDPGYFGTGRNCTPVCVAPCVHGVCTAPNTCTCDNSTVAAGPAWQGPECTQCVQGSSACNVHATCSDVGPLHELSCLCNNGWEGDGLTCAPVCSTPCGEHGDCVAPDTCECKLGWTGNNCTVDCGCHEHSTCDVSGVGVCDQCQNHTEGASCDTCSDGYWGDPRSGSACSPCQCNNHGTCDRVNGTCICDSTTIGASCSQCRSGLIGNAANGGACAHTCSRYENRLLITESSGWIASANGSQCNYPPTSSCSSVQETCSFVIQVRWHPTDIHSSDSHPAVSHSTDSHP
jgi:hypothetical protein